MKKAYYILNLMKFFDRHCRGDLSAHLSQSVSLFQEEFASIQKAGFITTANEFYGITDRLVGREGYLTLSVEKCEHWMEGAHFDILAMFGFMFDAQQLLEQGALLAIDHLDKDYDRITSDIFQRVSATLLSDEDDEDKYYTLLAMLEEPEENATISQQVIEEVQQALRSLHAQKLLQGHAAIAHLKTAPDDGSCQILVWQKLAISQAIGTIEFCEETFL